MDKALEGALNRGHDRAVTEQEQRIRRGDRRFVFRLVLVGAVALLLGAWVFLAMNQVEFGDCAARGFKMMTDPPARAPDK